ncbi:MAG: hypothetical protein AAGA85_19385 [Bacteroidota bacterium]
MKKTLLLDTANRRLWILISIVRQAKPKVMLSEVAKPKGVEGKDVYAISRT